jgi:SAM-dependent methyltransferase
MRAVRLGAMIPYPGPMADSCDLTMRKAQRSVWQHLTMVAPYQPATNFWRAIELPMLAGALPKQGRGLDIGCGDGTLTTILRQLVGGIWDLTGIDIDRSEIALAKGSDVYDRVAVAKANQLPLPDACLDFVFANSVLEHIPNLTSALAEIARCLRPDGLFLATVPGPEFHKCLQGPGWMHRMDRNKYLAELDERLLHYHYWSADRWNCELHTVGLAPGPSLGYLTRKHVELWERWSNWTGGVAYWISRRQQRPVEIQRRLGIRRCMPSWMGPVSHVVARLMSPFVGCEGELSSDIDACLLVRARKGSEWTA